MIKPGERVVTIATGSGLKAASVVRQPENSVFEVKLDEIEGVLKKLEGKIPIYWYSPKQSAGFYTGQIMLYIC